MNCVTIAGAVVGAPKVGGNWTYLKLAVRRTSAAGHEPGVIYVNVRVRGTLLGLGPPLEEGNVIGLTGWLVDEGEHGDKHLEVECEARRLTRLGG